MLKSRCSSIEWVIGISTRVGILQSLFLNEYHTCLLSFGTVFRRIHGHYFNPVRNTVYPGRPADVRQRCNGP